jgi:hypothetical protein
MNNHRNNRRPLLSLSELRAEERKQHAHDVADRLLEASINQEIEQNPVYKSVANVSPRWKERVVACLRAQREFERECPQ